MHTKNKKYSHIIFYILILLVVILPSALLKANNCGSTIVLSNSMEPAITTFSLNIVKYCDTSNINVGDIVLYRSEKRDINIIHRVVSIESVNGNKSLTVKGDANPTADSEYITDSNIIGKLVHNLNWTAPIISYVTNGTGYSLSVYKLLLILVFLVISLILIVYSILINYFYKRKLQLINRGGKEHMYNANNEQRTVLADVKKNDKGDFIRVSFVNNGKSKSYDIRNMYTENGEEKYAKGVRVKDEQLVDVLFAILNDMDADNFNALMDKVNTTIEIE